MLICDTSGLFAYFIEREKGHGDVRAAVDTDRGPFVVSPYVVEELDYLVLDRRGVQAELSVLAELGSGSWELTQFDTNDLRLATKVVERYQDQEIGLTDASLVVLASRYRTDRILTLDHRHFAVLRTTGGEPFVLLP